MPSASQSGRFRSPRRASTENIRSAGRRADAAHAPAGWWPPRPRRCRESVPCPYRQARSSRRSCPHRNGRIDPMDVIEVDDVGLEPPEALLTGFAHILRPSVREARVAEQPEIAKLARDDVIAAVLSDRLGYELLVAAASIAVGGVEQIDADLARPPDRRDSRGAVRLAIEWGHRAAAETNGRNLQLPKPATPDMSIFDSACVIKSGSISHWAGIEPLCGSTRLASRS